MSTGCAAGWSFLREWIRGQYRYLYGAHFRATYIYVQVSLVPYIVHRVMTELKHWQGEATVEHIQYSVYKNTPHYMYKLNPIFLHALISPVEKVASLSCMMEWLNIAGTPSAPWALHPSRCHHWIIFDSMRKDRAIWANCGLIRLYNTDNYVSAWRQAAGRRHIPIQHRCNLWIMVHFGPGLMFETVMSHGLYDIIIFAFQNINRPFTVQQCLSHNRLCLVVQFVS